MVGKRGIWSPPPPLHSPGRTKCQPGSNAGPNQMTLRAIGSHPYSRWREDFGCKANCVRYTMNINRQFSLLSISFSKKASLLQKRKYWSTRWHKKKGTMTLWKEKCIFYCKEYKWMTQKLDDMENCSKWNNRRLVGFSKTLAPVELQQFCENKLPKTLSLLHSCRIKGAHRASPSCQKEQQRKLPPKTRNDVFSWL